MNENHPLPSRSANFKMSTRELLGLIGSNRTYMGEDETYAVHDACVQISNRLYHEIGAEAHKNNIWPLDEALLGALRSSLDDNAHTYAGYTIAYTLVRCGRRDPSIAIRLNPWQRIAIGWREKGYTGSRVAEMLRQAEIARELPDETIAEIDRWIQEPFSALDEKFTITDRLFGQKLVYNALEHNGFQPGHDELFQKLARVASPSVTVTDINQTVEPQERFKDITATTSVLSTRNPDGTLREMHVSELPPDTGAILSDADSHWIVEYAYEGNAHGFVANCYGSYMDVEAVMRHFDEFMGRLGRPDRVYRLSQAPDEGHWGFFVVAHHDKFPGLAVNLGIPLHERAA